ncbi:MAG: hypothetical protein ABIG94_10155 [Pseudomonadota bacterium]
MPETENLEIMMVITAVEVILTTEVATEAMLTRQLQTEIRLESVDLTEQE